MTTLTSIIHIPEDVLFREVGGEAVILNLATGKYYGLDEVGTRMWALLAEHGSVGAVAPILLQEYEVDEERLKADLLELVDKLAAQELVKIDAE